MCLAGLAPPSYAKRLTIIYENIKTSLWPTFSRSAFLFLRNSSSDISSRGNSDFSNGTRILVPLDCATLWTAAPRGLLLCRHILHVRRSEYVRAVHRMRGRDVRPHDRRELARRLRPSHGRLPRWRVLSGPGRRESRHAHAVSARHELRRPRRLRVPLVGPGHVCDASARLGCASDVSILRKEAAATGG